MGNVIKFCLDSIDRLGDMTIILGLRLFSTFCDVFRKNGKMLYSHEK